MAPYKMFVLCTISKHLNINIQSTKII